VAGFEAIALGLAADRDRRAAMRAGLRAALRQSPLGQGEAFARDFYSLIASAVGPT
jgi:protein O-GlcNAc transferase